MNLSDVCSAPFNPDEKFTFEPSYLSLYRHGTLQERAERLWKMLEACQLCPHQCGVNRLADQRGVCGIGRQAMVASYMPHFGEEPALVGIRGSGTIFFTGCSLRCIFCQNYELSQCGEGEEVSAKQLAEFMLELQAEGCHNINLVTPTHVVPHILQALLIAIEEGLRVPLVYNTGGYDRVETLRELDGIIDIYLPDMKFEDDAVARRLSLAPNYPNVNKAAIREMYRQVGNLQVDENGIARRGLLVRHLVLPHGLAGTKGIVDFLAKEISEDAHINIMDQYHPTYLAHEVPEINRRLTAQEYAEAIRLAYNAGLHCFENRRTRLFL